MSNGCVRRDGGAAGVLVGGPWRDVAVDAARGGPVRGTALV